MLISPWGWQNGFIWEWNSVLVGRDEDCATSFKRLAQTWPEHKAVDKGNQFTLHGRAVATGKGSRFQQLIHACSHVCVCVHICLCACACMHAHACLCVQEDYHSHTCRKSAWLTSFYWGISLSTGKHLQSISTLLEEVHVQCVSCLNDPIPIILPLFCNALFHSVSLGKGQTGRQEEERSPWHSLLLVMCVASSKIQCQLQRRGPLGGPVCFLIRLDASRWCEMVAKGESFGGTGHRPVMSAPLSAWRSSSVMLGTALPTCRSVLFACPSQVASLMLRLPPLFKVTPGYIFPL